MTARRLVLIRHAKARDAERDIDRPLAGQGRDDAAVIGRWLAGHAVPDLAVVSPALRARQTWDCAVAALPQAPPVVVDDRVYDNTLGGLVEAVRSCDESTAAVALVGHNPSIQALAARAGRDGDGGMEALLSYPTATVSLLELDGTWSAFDPSECRLVVVEVCRAQ